MFFVGQIGVCLLLVRRDLWLLTTVKTIARELGAKRGVNYEVTPRKISQLCRRMKAKAVSFCETAAQRRAVHPVTEDKLEEWGVLTRRGGRLVATNAFALLSGDKALRTVVKCGIFRGTEHRKLLDSREFGGPVQDQIDAVHEWLLSKINMAAVIKGVYRHDVYEFPEGALRELVTNAVMHRNYAVYGSDT